MQNQQTTSKITGGPVDFVFSANVLNKYKVNYYRCQQTGFLQTETPYWLDEAYSKAISILDVGYVHRNLRMAEKTEMVIGRLFDQPESYLDYGAGYGMFVRTMRDRGYDFRRVDPYCENLFAQGFDDVSEPGRRYKMLTAFEVFEHLVDPISALDEMFRYSQTILFSTKLVPNKEIRDSADWWYFVPETGQHVSFYTEAALQAIAEKFGARVYSSGHSLHMLTRDPQVVNPFHKRWRYLMKRLRIWLRGSRPKPVSLLDDDFETVRLKLTSPMEKAA